jgi:iron-sulfur cluster repair protein YtfE (RIC family)
MTGGAESIPDNGDPKEAIEFILWEHLRHRQMCRSLERLARMTEFDPVRIARLADFVRFDLTLHVIDEEEDFFPMLRGRCPPDDGVDEVLDQMTDEHAADKVLSVRVRDVLSQCLIERKPPIAVEGGAQVLLNFASHEMRHMTLENAVVIPLARRRLTAEDLAALGERFAARRRRLSGAV